MEGSRRKSLEEVRSILSELKRKLSMIYGSWLKYLFVYGSSVRGEAEEGSDLDLMLVPDHATDALAERERLSELLLALSLKYGIVLSMLPVKKYTLEQEQRPLFTNAEREGIAV